MQEDNGFQMSAFVPVHNDKAIKPYVLFLIPFLMASHLESITILSTKIQSIYSVVYSNSRLKGMLPKAEPPGLLHSSLNCIGDSVIRPYFQGFKYQP